MTGVQMNGEQGSYTYNGDGVLVRAQGSWGQNERYAVDLAAPLSQVLQVQYPMGSTTALYGLGRLGLQENGATTWLLSDALGSVRQTTDSGGTPGWGVWYDPWGQVEQGAVPTFGFAGEQHDTFTGQVYLRARWYAPGQGRFLSWRWAEGESNDLIPYSHHAYAYAHSNPFNWTDPTGKCIPYIEADCVFASDPSQYDYVGASHVVVTGLGVMATIVVCGVTAGLGCAAGAAGAAAVTSWGNQALNNLGQPIKQAAISNINWNRVGIDAVIAAIAVPVAGFIGKGIGKALTKAADAVATRVIIQSDIAISRQIAQSTPVTAEEAGEMMANRGKLAGMAESWMNMRGFSVLYRGQGSATSEVLSPLARKEGISASESLIKRLRDSGLTDEEIAGFTARYHDGIVPQTGECLGAAGIPSTQIIGVAGPYAGESGIINVLRVPSNLPVKPASPWYPAEYEMVFFNNISKGSVVKTLPSNAAPWLTALDDEMGRLTVTSKSIYP
jgi:RHS repeat-associated protein